MEVRNARCWAPITSQAVAQAEKIRAQGLSLVRDNNARARALEQERDALERQKLGLLQDSTNVMRVRQLAPLQPACSWSHG
jgi:hypothetical protein